MEKSEEKSSKEIRKETEALLAKIIHENTIALLKKSIKADPFYFKNDIFSEYDRQNNSIPELSISTLKRIMEKWEQSGRIQRVKPLGYILSEDLYDIRQGSFEKIDPSFFPTDIKPFPTQKNSKSNTIKQDIKKATPNKKSIFKKVTAVDKNEKYVFQPTPLQLSSTDVNGRIIIDDVRNIDAKRISNFIDDRFFENIKISKFEKASSETGKLEIIVFTPNEDPLLTIKRFLTELKLVLEINFKIICSTEEIAVKDSNGILICRCQL